MAARVRLRQPFWTGLLVALGCLLPPVWSAPRRPVRPQPARRRTTPAPTAAARPAPVLEPPAVLAPEQLKLAREATSILHRHCFGCHGEIQQRSRLDLSERASALRGGARGPALVPGDPAQSRLYRRITAAESPAMPFDGKALEPAEVETLREWIAAGAFYPPAGDELDRDWWAFQPVKRPDVPRVSDPGWVRNPIDAFVLARLEREGLKPAPVASRRTLMRRLRFNLVGLPPTPEQIKKFEADTRADSYEGLVEELLATPQYGEHWARKWLDLARYADSAGFQDDEPRPEAWRYRDYVVNAFNSDRPYHRFIQEQLAADEIDPGNRDIQPALGFLALGPAERLRPEFTSDELDGVISTTTSVFLAQSVACARCHDHKYDPIPQKDYYRMAALFAGLRRKDFVIADSEEIARAEIRSAEIDLELQPLQAELEAFEAPYRAQVMAMNRGKVDEGKLAKLFQGAERMRRDELKKRITALERRKPRLTACHIATDSGRLPPPTYFLLGGEQNRRGPKVSPGFLTVLNGGKEALPDPPAGAATSFRRKALAEWITSPQNPLTARVLVNRVWGWHFGTGLVATPSDFGRNGASPSHPELLDWLTDEFIRHGWSIKYLQRLIVTSATYRQAHAESPELEQKDPEHRLLAGFPLRRLEAEEIRDAMLFTSGVLNPELGGPGIFPPVDPTIAQAAGPRWPDAVEGPAVWRRSLYIFRKRSLVLPLLQAFDCPDGVLSQPVRERTTVVNQALALLNDPFSRSMAEHLAERVRAEAGEEPASQLHRLQVLTLGRPLDEEELKLGLEFLAEQRRNYASRQVARPAPRRRGQPAPAPAAPRVDPERAALTDYCQALFNLSEFLYVE